MVEVFTDTSAWYACFVPTDPRHNTARRTYERLRSAGARLHTTDWVLVETVALMHRRAGPEAARTVCLELLSNPAVETHCLDDELLKSSGERYRASAGSVSWVDASSFTVMEKLGITRAFAFDRDFTSAGFTLESR